LQQSVLAEVGQQAGDWLSTAKACLRGRLSGCGAGPNRRNQLDNDARLGQSAWREGTGGRSPRSRPCRSRTEPLWRSTPSPSHHLGERRLHSESQLIRLDDSSRPRPVDERRSCLTGRGFTRASKNQFQSYELASECRRRSRGDGLGEGVERHKALYGIDTDETADFGASAFSPGAWSRRAFGSSS